MARTVQGQDPVIETTEAQIAVHWREEEYYYPSAKFIGQANLTEPNINKRFREENFPAMLPGVCRSVELGSVAAHRLSSTPAIRLSGSGSWVARLTPRTTAWTGTLLNTRIRRRSSLSRNRNPKQPYPSPTASSTRVANEFAALLRDFCGLKSGDRVTIHMPMVPELPVTMLACARLGVIHSVVFGGFSGEACGRRVADSGSHVLITMDGYYRNGNLLDHKAAADISLDIAKQEGQVVEKVLVWRRHPGKNASASPFVEGRDFFVDEILPNYSGEIVPPVPMDDRGAAVASCTPAAAPESPKDVNTALAATLPMSRAAPNISRTSTPKMCTGAWPISARLPDTRLLSMDPWPWLLPASSTKASRPTPTQAGSGESLSAWMSTVSTLAHGHPHVAQGQSR